MGGPIDTRASPTSVNDLATQRPLSWFSSNVLATVPFLVGHRDSPVTFVVAHPLILRAQHRIGELRIGGDLIVLATVVRETIGGMAEARKLGSTCKGCHDDFKIKD